MAPALLGLICVLGQLQPLPPELVPLDSEEGRTLLLESKANRDYFTLSAQFLTQRNQAFCGVASTVMVLNSLPIAAPELAELKPFRAFTEANVFSPELGPLNAQFVGKGGLTLEQLGALLRGNHAEAVLHYAEDGGLDAFRAEVKQNLATAGDFILVDFLRGELGQDLGAHWSPIAAFHEGSDRILVLDVARFRYPPYWVKTEALFRAMNTEDLDAGKHRGWVSVRAAVTAPGRIDVPSVRHRIFALGASVGGGLFALGALAGALVMRWRMRRGR
jgi:hypothetical protein